VISITKLALHKGKMLSCADASVGIFKWNYGLSESAMGFKGWFIKADVSIDYFKYMMMQK